METTFTTAQQQFDIAAEILGLDPEVREIMRQPKRELIVHFPAKMDNGEVRTFKGYRVHHNIARGPALGGLRYAPNITLEEMRALSMWMTWSSAIVQIPYGGAKGGIVCNHLDLSITELERITRRYVTEITPLLGPERDVIMPDLNTSAQTMAWVMDTYSMQRGFTSPAIATGKPVQIGGTQGRSQSTAHGMAYVVKQAAQAINLPLEGAKVVMIGSGNAGRQVMRVLGDELGCVIIAASDDNHAIINQEGLDLPTFFEHRIETKSVKDFTGATAATPKALVGLECDILILGAGQGDITGANAGSIKAKLVVELANGPITPTADAILAAKNIPVVPDILANAGSIVVSYFEWVQGLQEFFWTEREVNLELERIMTRSFNEIESIAKERNIQLRTAAYLLAVERVTNAMAVRGIYP